MRRLAECRERWKGKNNTKWSGVVGGLSGRTQRTITATETGQLATHPLPQFSWLMSWHVLCSSGKEMGIWGALKILCMTIFLYSWNNFHIIPGLVSGVHTLATVVYRFWLCGDSLGVVKSKNMLVVRNKSSGLSGKLTVLVIHLWWALTTSYHWYSYR